MIHPRSASPSCTPHRKRRQTNSARSSIASAKSVQQDERKTPTEIEEPVPIRYSDVYKQKKAQAEMGNMYRKKKSHPIAPDAFIPNSSFRMVFRRKEIKPIAIKEFQLRLDILANLQNKNLNSNWGDDDEKYTELDDPDAESPPAGEKKPKGTLVSRPQNTIPELFKRMQNESWWKQAKEEKLNVKSMLLYLMEILKLKQIDSYESACYYIVEIFRTYGIEPTLVNQIFEILFEHLTKNRNDRLDICTVRTIAQFMLERKMIIVRLLEYALKCQANDHVRLEVVNAVKFITDVNNSDEINLVLENMSVVYDAPEENFSLKMIIKGLASKKKTVVPKVVNEEEAKSDHIHPLLKQISEERWFPRGNLSITLEFVLEAIIAKLPNASKTMLKTLTSHLVQLHRVLGYSKEQFDRVANALISLLSHTDADHRLIAATTLANFNKETKAIDIALLNTFRHDARILVRTECGESLKKLTGIMSETVLKDCADDISYLQTLAEENFTLQNYLKEKNRVPTPPPPTPVEEEPPASLEEPSILVEEPSIVVEEPSIVVEEPSIVVEEPPSILPLEEKVDDAVEDIPVNDIEQNLTVDQIEINEEIVTTERSRSPLPQIIEQPTVINTPPLPIQSPPTPVSVTPIVSSSKAPIELSIGVETNEKHDAITLPTPRSPKEQTKQPILPTKTPIPEPINKKPSSLLPITTSMLDSFMKQNNVIRHREDNESDLSYLTVPQPTLVDQEQGNDPIRTIIEEHKRTVGFYRIPPNRRLLIPHKISMDNILADQSHIIINEYASGVSKYPTNSMNLSDFHHNQHQLKEVEFVQLLSSLVVRAMQLHRHYEKYIPGLSSPNFTDVLSVSSIPLQSSASFQQSTGLSNTRLPFIVPQQSSMAHLTRIQANIQAKAAREGINIHKAQNMEGALSNLLRTNREPTKTTVISSFTSFFSSPRRTDATHAGLLVQLLKSQGVIHSESYLQKIILTYPKFIPLLNTKVPSYLVSIIWNDPTMRRIAAIFSDKQEQSSVTNSSTKYSDTKPSVVTTDDASSLNAYDNATLLNRDRYYRKSLPAIRSSKKHFPRHVVKFGFREIDMDLSESSHNSSLEESTTRIRKRRVYMHMMIPANENTSDRHESVKSQLQQTNQTDYETTSYVPIVSRPPLCH